MRIDYWWNNVARYSNAKRLGVRGRRYKELTGEEKGKVYHYWATGKYK